MPATDWSATDKIMTNLDDNYAQAYGQKAGFGKRPALILIDFVEGYFDPECDLYAGVEETLKSALRVREAAHAASIPVVLTNVIYHPSAMDGGRFFEKARPLRFFLQGSPMGAWPKGLEPKAAELVISKQYPSAFFGTSLASTLTSLGVESCHIDRPYNQRLRARIMRGRGFAWLHNNSGARGRGRPSRSPS